MQKNIAYLQRPLFAQPPGHYYLSTIRESHSCHHHDEIKYATHSTYTQLHFADPAEKCSVGNKNNILGEHTHHDGVSQLQNLFIGNCGFQLIEKFESAKV